MLLVVLCLHNPFLFLLVYILLKASASLFGIIIFLRCRKRLRAGMLSWLLRLPWDVWKIQTLDNQKYFGKESLKLTTFLAMAVILFSNTTM